MVKILILFYSTYGHTYQLAKECAEGCKEVPGAEIKIRQVPETLTNDILGKMHALEAKKAFEHVPLCTMDDLKEADGIIFGTPTRFGMMCAQMKNFLDATGQLWMKGSLIGKAGSVFTSTGGQHGGQETTITNFHTVLLHHGMVIVGLPYSFAGLNGHEEVSGCSPYGASTIAGAKGDRLPSYNELKGIKFQGKHVAEIAAKLAA